MLAFVTSLRHPQNSSDYRRVEDLLELTLASVTAQTSDDYAVVVVGNKAPSFALPPKVHFVEVDFPPPAPPTGARTAREPFVWDKGTKIGIGLAAARAFDPDYVMIFDADDFVHRDLAAYVNDRPGRSGWVVEDGYVYSRSRAVFRRQPRFNRTCGTSFVIPYDAYGVSPALEVTAGQVEVAAVFGEWLPAVLGAHRDAVAWFADHGRALEPLPFRAAVYHVDTGENHSGKCLEGLAIPVTSTFAAEFGVPPVRWSAAAVWAGLGPRRVLETAVALAGQAARRAVSVLRRLVRRP
jgi:hypothetical protein